MTNEAKKQLAKLPESVKKSLADGMNAGAAALVEDITKEMLNKGFSRKQADRVLNYELRKLQDYGQEISVGALQSIAEKLLR